jgi:hypothetical protein
MAFRRWADDLGLRVPAQAFLDVLRAPTARVDLLFVTLRRLAAASSILSVWADEDVDLCGLARIASALRTHPEIFSLGLARDTPPSTQILSRFRGQAESHYLYACWSVRDPFRQSAKAWLDVFRLWLLVQNLQRVVADPNGVHDRLIGEAASRVRMACEETGNGKWLPTIERISGPFGWHALRQHFESIADRASGSEGSADADQQSFYKILGRVARGEARPVGRRQLS